VNPKHQSGVDEHTAAILLALFLNVSPEYYPRLSSKWSEEEYSKVARLVNLFETYFEKLEDAEKKWQIDHADVSASLLCFGLS